MNDNGNNTSTRCLDCEFYLDTKEAIAALKKDYVGVVGLNCKKRIIMRIRDTECAAWQESERYRIEHKEW